MYASYVEFALMILLCLPVVQPRLSVTDAPASYAHLFALKDRALGTVAAWVPSGGGAAR